MKPYSDFKVSTEGFRKDLRANMLEAHADMVGTCSVSIDPKVRGAWERWKTIAELVTFLEKSGKEQEERGE